ncbi:MAG TPA: dephospho-CoA kinase [Jiangellaceae bacterium]|nr:dephospho-CoA kinase [Jiangellaceae bacterium]
MLRVGLTGGIGSGKSTVAARLEEHGALVVDADRIAREVVEPGTPGLAAVVEEFGPGVLAPDGSLDRPALGRIVFGDDGRRAALNAIVHPLVYSRRTELVAAAPIDAIVVEDIPLLVENSLGAGFQLVMVVHAPAAERVRRIVASRTMTEEDAWARVQAQADDEARRAAADVWLDNSGSRDEIRAAVDTIWTERLVPFEANLRAGREAERSQNAVLTDPDPTWPAQAARLAERIRHCVRERGLRVDHIGSTSVPGLAAKDVVDLQVVCVDLPTARDVAGSLGDAGLVRMPGRWWDVGRDGLEYDKGMACNADPGRAANVHVRPLGSPTWRDALLLRDWLRATPSGAREYEALKRELAAQSHETIDEYAERKSPWVTDTLARADEWAAQTRWSPA